MTAANDHFFRMADSWQ